MLHQKAASAASAGPAGPVASAAAPTGRAQSVLAQMQNQNPQPASTKASEPESTNSGSSMIWGVVGGALLLGLFLFKKSFPDLRS